MKFVTTTEGSFLQYLDRKEMFADYVAYEDLLYSGIDQDSYQVILLNISDKDSEGVYSPRSLISNGIRLPIIGLANEMSYEDDHAFENDQVVFLEQGGLYLLREVCSPSLLAVCMMQAAAIGEIYDPNQVLFRDYQIDDQIMRVDLKNKLVFIDGLRVPLTTHEYLMVEKLALKEGQVVTKEQFLNHLYNGMDLPELKIIDVYLCKVRKKIAPFDEIIETVWGRGYKINKLSNAKKKIAA